MTDNSKLLVSVSGIEIAEALSIANAIGHDSQISWVIRRLAFERDYLVTRMKEAKENKDDPEW